MKTLSIDIETFSSVDLIKCGVYAYVEAPDFEILLFGYAWDDEPDTVIDLLDFESIPEEVMDTLTDQTIIKAAFNANFERVCIAKHFNLTMDPAQWRCTSVHALTLGLPNNLDGVAKALKLEAKKDSAGKALIRYFSIPCKPTKTNGMRTRNMPYHDSEKWEKYKAYCGQDVVVERTIKKKLEKYPVPEFEQRLWEIDQAINDRGVRIETKLVENAIACDTGYQK